MLRNALLSPALIVSLLAHAGIAPQHSTTAYAHHLEVNAQWAARPHLSAAYGEQTRFADDVERIAAHLFAVHEQLSLMLPDGIPAVALERRNDLLDSLHAYALRGSFPQNHVLPYRNPVFIDPHGTPCAVGYLMIASGHRPLAERIDAEMETAYLEDIRYPEVDAWAQAHGFSRSELAWIQPGYLPAVPWSALGGGTNGAVNALHALPDGRLLVAGSFTTAGGAAHQNVAVWNGSAFTALGNGVDGVVHCALADGATIYLGGSFAGGDLATWSGSTWTITSAMDGVGATVYALHMHAGELHAAGSHQGFAGPIHQVRKRATGVWVDAGSHLDDQVHALASHGGRLVAGGAFNNAYGPTDPVLGHIAELVDGEWHMLGNGLDAAVHTLLSANDMLYAGGVLFEADVPRFGLARITGTAWEELLPNKQDYLLPVDPEVGPSVVNTLAQEPAGIVFGGNFLSGSIMDMGRGLSRWTEVDQIVHLGLFADAVHTAVWHNDHIIAGGAFTQVNFAANPHLAINASPSGTGTTLTHTPLRAWPNPVQDQLFLELDVPARYTVLDAGGRCVRQSSLSAVMPALDMSALAPGAYTLTLTTAAGELRSARFLKQ